MPLLEMMIQNRGVDVDKEVENNLRQVLKLLDAEIERLSLENSLSRAKIRFLCPLHVWVLVGDVTINVVLSVHDVGGAPFWRVVDHSNNPMDWKLFVG